MKKKITIFIMLILFLVCMHSLGAKVSASTVEVCDISIDATNFPDKEFRAAVYANDSNSDGILSVEENKKIKEIKIEKPYGGHTYLTGIKYFQWLEKLYVTVTADLQGEEEILLLPELKSLTIDGCNWEKITEPHMESLEELCIKENIGLNMNFQYLPNLKRLQIKTDVPWMDISEYLQMQEETDLELDSTLKQKCVTRSEIDLSKNKKLEELYIERLLVEDIDLSNNTKLKTLEIIQNSIRTLDLSNNLKLQKLDVTENRLKSLDLRNNKKLRKLICDENKLEKLFLKGASELRYLSAEKNRLKELNISENLKLRYLYVSKNKIKKVDASEHKFLKSLIIEENNLSKLSVQNCSSMNFLDCDDNKIKVIELKGCTKLNSFFCSRNKIKKLDVSELKRLESFSCKGNLLEELDVSKNKKLYTLNCNGNRIKQLDISKNKRLFTLSCAWNRIKRLDLSKNNKLATASFSNNNMKYLKTSDLRVVFSSYEIYCENIGNDIRTLDIRDVVALGGFCKKNVRLWMIKRIEGKNSDSNLETVIASKKLPKKEQKYLNKQGKKYGVKIRYV